MQAFCEYFNRNVGVLCAWHGHFVSIFTDFLMIYLVTVHTTSDSMNNTFYDFVGGARVCRPWYCEKPCNYGCQSQSQMTFEAKKKFPHCKKMNNGLKTLKMK